MKTKKLLLWSNLFFLLFVLSCSREEVDIPVNADFSFEVVGADYSIPVQIAFANTSSGAQGYHKCPGLDSNQHTPNTPLFQRVNLR